MQLTITLKIKNNKKQKNMENKNFSFCLKVPDKILFSVPQNIEFLKITIRTLRCKGQPHLYYEYKKRKI